MSLQYDSGFELGTDANTGAHNHITFDKIIFLKIDSLNVYNRFQNLYANIIVKLKIEIPKYLAYKAGVYSWVKAG